MEFEKLKKIIAEVLNVDVDEITMDTTFVDDLGADSLDIFQIITRFPWPFSFPASFPTEVVFPTPLTPITSTTEVSCSNW